MEAVTCKAGHPFRKFTTGNTETLLHTPKAQGINVLHCLSDFHLTNYSASVMSLVMSSRDELDVSEQLILKLFSKVRNVGTTLFKWTESPFGPQECMKWIEIQSVADVKDLHICFSIPDTRPFYHTLVR